MKKYIILLIALSLMSLAFADVIVGTGTSAGYPPMSSYYKYYRSAALYTAAEIGAGDGTISHLQWYNNTAGNTTAINVKIYLKYTSSSVLTTGTWSSYAQDAIQVFHDTIQANAVGWYNIDIDDFAYSSSNGNLMVLVETGETPYVSPHAQWRYTSTSSIDYRFLTANSDGGAPTDISTSYNRPNIKFVGINSNQPPQPATIVSPSNNASGILPTASLNWNESPNTTNYKLYFGTNGGGVTPPTNIANGLNLGNVMTYDPSPDMDWETVYYWQIVPENAIGPAIACPIWKFTTRVNPTKPLPYSQDFNSGTTASAIDWSTNMSIGANHGTDGSNGLYKNLYSYANSAGCRQSP